MKGIANKTLVGIYGEPDEYTSLIDELLYGMPVIVIETISPFHKWLYIETEYGYRGYVKKEHITLEYEDSTYQQWESTKKMRVNKSFADVLSKPKVQGVLQMGIPRGGLIAYLGKAEQEEPGWARVMLVDGRYGYMKESFLEEPGSIYGKSEEEIRNQVVKTAKSYLGTQYRWGGKSPLGIDCSGLTSISYLINGIITYRDAKIVEGFAVHEIKFEEKKPADLLYFKGHIAMMIDGKRYIHSTGRTGSDGVVINSLDPKDSDYREDLAKGILAVGSVF